MPGVDCSRHYIGSVEPKIIDLNSYNLWLNVSGFSIVTDSVAAISLTDRHFIIIIII